MTTQEAPNQKIADRIKKLLALAKVNANENEASAAMGKVQELLAQYNLSLAEVENSKSKSDDTAATRTKDKYEKSAMYSFQQHLMRDIAESHFCMYWVGEKSRWTGKTWAKQKYHVLIGREANVATAKHMFDYLNGIIEQLCREQYPHPLNLSKSAISWKEGCAHRLCQRLRERKTEADEANRVKTEVTPAPTTGTALMLLTDLRRTENDLNQDFAYGDEPGTTALRRAQWLAKRDEPKETVEAKPETEKERIKREKDSKKYWEREQKKRDKHWANKDMTAFWQGHNKGNDIGLDTQIHQGGQA